MKFGGTILFPFASLSVNSTNTTSPPLNLTAISARDGHSVLECWSLTTHPPQSFRGASNYQIGDFVGGYIGVIPPRTYIGTAWAPYVQYSIFLSGMAHITLPNSTAEAWVGGGKYGIIIAADLKHSSASGHITEFPSSDETVLVQLPIPNNIVPDHTVLHDGPCSLEDLIRL